MTKGVVICPYLSKEFASRGQADLVDTQSMTIASRGQEDLVDMQSMPIASRGQADLVDMQSVHQEDRQISLICSPGQGINTNGLW